MSVTHVSISSTNIHINYSVLYSWLLCRLICDCTAGLTAPRQGNMLLGKRKKEKKDGFYDGLSWSCPHDGFSADKLSPLFPLYQCLSGEELSHRSLEETTRAWFPNKKVAVYQYPIAWAIKIKYVYTCKYNLIGSSSERILCHTYTYMHFNIKCIYKAMVLHLISHLGEQAKTKFKLH